MENISWTDRVRNEVLHKVTEDRNILQNIKRGKAKWIVYILRMSYFIKHIIEGKV